MEESFKISFTGDISLSKYYSEAKVSELVFSEKIKFFLEDSNACVFNVETAIGEKENKLFSHVSSKEIVSILGALGPSGKQIWNLANNHVMDIGESGLESTIHWARMIQSCTIGAGKNLQEASQIHYLNLNCIHIGMFSCGSTEEGCGCMAASKDSAGVFSWDEVELIKRQIEEIKKTCRWCVMVIHCGNEFHTVPLPEMREKIHSILCLGADIIVCHHPHVVQGYEFFENGNKAVFYSLGNFVFDTDYQRSQANTQIGCLLKINFYKNHFDFSYLGVNIGGGPKGPIEVCESLPHFQEYTEKTYFYLLKLSAWYSLLAEFRKRRYLYSTSKRVIPSFWACLAICNNILRKRICWKLLKASVGISIN